MKHCILVKWNETVTDKQAMVPEVEAAFAPCRDIVGVTDVAVEVNVVDRPNRYDLMVVLSMDPAALPAYDASAAHRAWKENYGARIAKKAIFDY